MAHESTTHGPYGVVETSWQESTEVDGNLAAGEHSGELQGQQKGILWNLLKQVRPGMDASRIILPTFCLEPRSFLDKASDVFFHADFLTDAAHAATPEARFLSVARWFISFFYKKPKGLQKPYNPLLGEIFRCLFELPAHPSGVPASRAFLVGEQVSHHPPITALVCSARQAGWVFQGTLVCGSKFYGNSALSTMDASFQVHLLETGEVYDITMPDMGIRGILLGSIMTEFAGKSIISCAKTGYSCDFDFKAKPVFGGSANNIEGVVKRAGEPVFKLKGKWDETVTLTKLADKSSSVLFENNAPLHARRLTRRIVPLKHQKPYTEEAQGHFESEITWLETTVGIKEDDQNKASKHKAFLEDTQRVKAKALESQKTPFRSRHFEGSCKHWTYKGMNFKPWDPKVDVYDYERDGFIRTLTTAEIDETTGLASGSAIEAADPAVTSPTTAHGDSHHGHHHPHPHSKHLHHHPHDSQLADHTEPAAAAASGAGDADII